MNNNKPAQNSIKVSLHGMNDRMHKMMIRFIELNCKGIAHVVEEGKSDAEIVDIDLPQAISILEERLAQQPTKPIIALSLNEVSYDHVIYLKKPIDTPNAIEALKKVKKKLKSHENALKRKNKLAKSSAAQPKLEPEKSERTNPANFSAPASKPKFDKNTSEVSTAKSTKADSSAVLDIKEPKPTTSTPKLTKPAQQKKDLLETIKPSASKSTPKKVSKNSISKTPNIKTTEDETVALSSANVVEIDKLLKELNNPVKKSNSSRKNKKLHEQKNQRKTTRYSFHPIEARLNKKSLTSLDNYITVLIIDISSKGALIKLKKPSKLRGKVAIKIKFDSKHVFNISARVARKENSNTYGLQFLEHQHELTNYLVNSGHEFFFS